MGLIPTFSKFQLDLLYCPVHKFIFKFLVISEISQVFLCKGDRWPTQNGVDRLYSETFQVNMLEVCCH